MATSTIKGMQYYEDGNAVTCSHTFNASVCRDGRMYIANLTITTISDVGSFTSLCRLKNVSMRNSQYVAGMVGNSVKLFYISAYGDIQPVGGIASGADIKVCIPLVLN